MLNSHIYRHRNANKVLNLENIVICWSFGFFSYSLSAMLPVSSSHLTHL